MKDKNQFYSLGKAVGEITRELSQVKIEIQSSYQPCYELEKSYPTCPLKDVIDFCDNPPEDFKSERGILGGLKKYFIEFKDIIPILRELPHQFIHGDINSSNVLEDEKRNICAILDFEFTARDLRCMDLAICLSEAIANDEDDKVKFDNITNFMTGYKKFISLTDDEIKELLQRQVDESTISFSISSDPVFKGKKAFMVMANPRYNAYDIDYVITVDGKEIKRTSKISPNQYIEEVELKEALPKGSYIGEALITGYNKETGAEVGKTIVELNITSQ